MALSNLSPQYISSSYQNLLQVSSSGAVYNGTGSVVTSLNVTASYISPSFISASVSAAGFTGGVQASASYASTASYTTYALTASYAVSASYEINYEASSSYAETATSASYAVSASYSTTLGASLYQPSSGVLHLRNSVSGVLTNLSALSAATAISASFATTASYISPTFISASAAAFGFGTGGGSAPGGSNGQIQYKSGSAFAGVPTLTYENSQLRAQGAFTGSFNTGATPAQAGSILSVISSGDIETNGSPIYQDGAQAWRGANNGTINLTTLGIDGGQGGSGLVIPVSAPDVPLDGSMYVNVSTNRLFIYYGGNWHFTGLV